MKYNGLRGMHSNYLSDIHCMYMYLLDRLRYLMTLSIFLNSSLEEPFDVEFQSIRTTS